MTPQDAANELHRVYRRGKDSGLSDAQIDTLLMLVEVVDWEQQKSTAQGNHSDRAVRYETETAIEGVM